MDWTACPAVERSAKTLSGAWRFKNTRVPVKAFFENLKISAVRSRTERGLHEVFWGEVLP